MSPTDFVWLAVAGIAGGALNTAAAGGGVITLVTCLLVGMPPQVAIATSQTAIPASFLGAVVPAWRQRRRYRPILPAVAAAAVGTAIGAWWMSRLDAHTIRALAPWLLIVAGVLLVIQPSLPRLLNRNRDLCVVSHTSGSRVPAGGAHPPTRAAGEVGELETAPTTLDSRRRRGTLTAVLFVVALYGGGFGGGVGVAVLVTLATVTGWAWDTTNTVKNGLCLLMSFMCSLAFLVTGPPHLGAVVVLAAGQLAGGVLGVRLFQRAVKRLSDRTLRRVVGTVIIITTGLGAVAAGNS